jgi:hypothetical protein
MSADTGTRRSEDGIGAVDERSSLQWARRKIEEVKARLRDDPGRAYSVEFTSAAEILHEHDPVEFNSLRRLLKDKLVRLGEFDPADSSTPRRARRGREACQKNREGAGC